METNTNFFTSIQTLLKPGLTVNLSLTMEGENMITSFLPGVNHIKDQAFAKLTPMILEYPAADLDAHFFETITTVLGNLNDRAEIIKAYEKQIDDAADSSKASLKVGDLSDQKEKEEERNETKAAELIKGAEQLSTEHKYSQALKKYEKAELLTPTDDKLLEAIRTTKMAIVKPMVEKAETLLSAQKLGPSIDEYKKAIHFDPLNPELAELKGKLIETMGETVFNQLTENKKV